MRIMRPIASAAFLALLSLPFSALAFRDDLATDAQSCAARYTDASPEWRLECHLQRQAIGCEGDSAAGDELDAALQGSSLPYRFQRGLQRFRARTGDERPFCDLPGEARREVMREALAPVRVRAESGKAWLMTRLKGASGEIDALAVENALRIRRQLTIDTLC